MILGLTGTICSGKGTVAEYLKSKGFEYYSYSDILREESKKRDLDETRVDLQNIANKLREEQDDLGYLSSLILKKIKTKKAVVDGVRNADEIRRLSKEKDFFLIGIDAPQKLRFRRLLARKRDGDPKTLKEFKEIDDNENLGKLPGQNLNECLQMADFLIENIGTIDELKEKVDDVLMQCTN